MRGEGPDAELLSSGLASDFGCFYDRHVRAVTAFVGSWIGQPDVVFDLVAETFARALEHRLQYKPSTGPTIAWLLGIARNLMIDSARRGQVESETRVRLGMGRVELDDEQVEVIADRADVRLRDALAALEAGQRDAVIRRVVLEESYTIAVFPQVGASTAGWESLIVYIRTGASIYLQDGGTLGYPTATGPVFGGGTGPDSCPVCFARGNAVTYVLTGPQVFAVRIGSQTIRTITSPALPSGDRAAVVFIPAKGRVLLIRGDRPVPDGKHPPGMKNVLVVRVLPLARSGQAIPRHFTTQPDGPPPLTWMAPDAVSRWWPLGEFTVPYQGPGHHAPTRPRPGVCELAQHGLPALHAQFGHTIAWIAPVPDALGEVFMSCVDTEYYLHGWPLQAGVLLDGHLPGQVLGPIPGARLVPGQPDMVNLPLGQVPRTYDTPISADSPQLSLTAKRVGDAWLVAQGGSGLAQRVQVLNSLRISKLNLHHFTSGHAPH